MNEAFELGVGVMDIFKDIPDNYGKQLDMVINEVLVKALKHQNLILAIILKVLKEQ